MSKIRSKLEDKVLFIKDKNESNILYVYVFNKKDTKTIVTDRIKQYLSKKYYKSDTIEIWHNYADIFKIKENKKIKHILSGNQYSIYNIHGIYHPNEKEIKTYLKLVKEGMKQIKEVKLQRKIIRLKETYRPVIEYIKYFRDCYTEHKGNETKIVKLLSDKIIEIADLYRINDIRFKLLVYGRMYSSVTANKDIKHFITEYIFSQIINNKSLSVTNIKSNDQYDVHVIIERKYDNSWHIYLDVTNKLNTNEETTNATSINTKGKDENLIVKISNFVNETFNTKEQK